MNKTLFAVLLCLLAARLVDAQAASSSSQPDRRSIPLSASPPCSCGQVERPR